MSGSEDSQPTDEEVETLALMEVQARQVISLVGGGPTTGQFTFGGRDITRKAWMELASLTGYLNYLATLRAARGK